MTNNPLKRDINFISIIKFVFPTIVMMLFMSLYTMVDGIFVSRFVGTKALSALNIAYPIFNVMIGIGVMFASGGSAVCAFEMGKGLERKARESFTSIIATTFIVAVVYSSICLIFMEEIMYLLGSNDAIYSLCHDYGFYLALFFPLAGMQMIFQYFFVTAGKPKLGLMATVLGGVTNIIMDYVFIVHMDLGIKGAALATGIGICMPAIFGLLYFSLNRKGSLYFVKPTFEMPVILKSVSNGSSEMVTNLASAITIFLFNIVMMNLKGEDGVAAITIILYTQFAFNAFYFGYSSGIAPITAYNYGNENYVKLKQIFKLSTRFLLACSFATVFIAISTADIFISVFAEYGSDVYFLAKNGFNLFSVAYLFMGTNIFASSFFTALSDGKTSALISFLRTFVFLVINLLLLPKLFGITGVWIAVPVAEFITVIFAVILFKVNRDNYNY